MFIEMENATEIIDGLFIGNESSALNYEFLTKNNIKCVIRIETYEPDLKILDMYDKLNIEYTRYSIYDLPEVDIRSYLNEIADVINDEIQHNNVLVHCYAGQCRSPTMVIAYLIKYKNMTLCESYTFVKNKRNISLNPSFFGQLYDVFEYDIINKNISHNWTHILISQPTFMSKTPTW